MKHRNLLTLSAALVLTVASAQQGGQGGFQGQLTPEQRAQFAKMRPIFDLAQDIRLLPDLEKNPATAMTKAQARQLLPILTTLQKAAAIQPNDAAKYLTQIEDKILTDKQVTAMDDLQLKAEQARAAQRAQRQASGQTPRIPGVPGGLVGGFGGQRPGAAQGQNAQNGQGGQFNPFKRGRTADLLKAYIAVLQKK